jgi:DNA-binding NtrC family response regulator/tetratricopeptide (TPR) repeat protein
VSAIDLGERYEYIRDLGGGGSGRVVLVRDRHLAMDLALKILDCSGKKGEGPTEAAVEEFRREFRILAAVDHPGIAKAFDFGFLGGRPYFTREYVPGDPLEKIDDPAEILEVARGCAWALAALHAAKILHLDLKPGNIIISRSGGRPRPVLIDFGLWRRGFAVFPGKTVKGSLPYMAPEHFRGGPLGPQTDIYALGATLYRAATGAFPRAVPIDRKGAVSPGEWEAVVPSLLHRRPSVPPDLDRVILKCLALDPAARFASARELLEALDRIGGVGPRRPARFGISRTVGREAEIAGIEGFLDGLGRHRPGEAGARRTTPVLLITGSPGMGMSHILREAKVIAQTRGIRFFLDAGAGPAAPPGAAISPLGSHLPAAERSRWEAFLARLGRPRRLVAIEALESERRLRRAAEVVRIAATTPGPTVLAIDGLQHRDEISIGLISDLARHLAAEEPARRPPLGLILGMRAEGTSAAIIRELTGDLVEGERAKVIALGPLGLRETLDLHGEAGGAAPDDGGFDLFQATGGAPSRIVALARGEKARDETGTSSAEKRKSPSSPARRERFVLLSLSLIGRPATTAELAAVTGLRREEVRRSLRKLEAAGLAAESDEGTRGNSWLPGPAAASMVEGEKAGTRCDAHRRIGLALCRGRSPARDPAFLEGVRHLRLSGSPALVAAHGLPAARYLKSTFQNRAAIDLYRAVLEATPRGKPGARVKVLLEMADLEAQGGDLDKGIDAIREVLDGARGLPQTLRTRLLLWLATLHTRRGDLHRAAGLFDEGFRLGRRGLSLEERLFFLNENASLRAVSGERDEALRLCEEGLRIAGKRRATSVREAVLTLLATRAAVALRGFDHDAAIRDYETALEMADAVGSPANGAVILNNLAAVYASCDRHDEAIAAFREAEKLSLRLDEGPSLVSIQGNLAVLHAKTGDFEASEKALAEGRRLLPEGIWRRQEQLFHHARGLAALYRGWPAEARGAFDISIRLGEEIGDALLVAFDRVFRAEALAVLALYSEASRELEDLARAERPGRVRRMALARRAFLHAFTGRIGRAERDREAAHGVDPGRPVPFLDAWDDLYLGWALSIESAGRPEAFGDALARIGRARDFFSRKGLRPALDLARWIEAEAHLFQGSPGTAEEVLRSGTGPGSDLTRILRPLLETRLLLSGERPPIARCADLLADAGAGLVGNPAPEWSLRLDALRAILQGDRSALAEVERKRERICRELPEADRAACRSSPSWKAWTSFAQQHFASAARPRRPREDAGARTATVHGRKSAARERIVARSRAMSELLSTLDRLRGSDLPVLIQGETGTGKELVARIIHEESGRAGGPLQVIDLSSIPSGLVEVELFGAKAGAFTDLKTDRPGLLALAGGGTILFDEVAGLPGEFQAKLLRVLGGGSYRRVGDEAERRPDVRFLFSTSRDLASDVKEGRFREDLYHRLAVLTVPVPPLRERKEDIPDLVKAFLEEGTLPRPRLALGVLQSLARRPWPGNVRELRNLIVRLRIERSRVIRVEDVRPAPSRSESPTFPRSLIARGSLEDLQGLLERDWILHHLERLGGDTTALARLLGLGRRQLYRRLRRLGIRLRGGGAKP